MPLNPDPQMMATRGLWRLAGSAALIASSEAENEVVMAVLKTRRGSEVVVDLMSESTFVAMITVRLGERDNRAVIRPCTVRRHACPVWHRSHVFTPQALCMAIGKAY